MGLEDIVNTAKDALGGVSDEQVDQAAEAAKNVAPDAADGVIDQAAEAAKNITGA